MQSSALSENDPLSTRWIASPLGRRNVAGAARQPNLLCFATPLQHATSDISNTHSQQEFAPQHTVLQQKVSPIGEVEAGHVHRLENLNFAKPDNGSTMLFLPPLFLAPRIAIIISNLGTIYTGLFVRLNKQDDKGLP